MKRMTTAFALALSLLLISTSSQAERNPVGETATYLLDNSRARTTSMIRKGTFTAVVTEALPDAEGGPAFNTKLTYDMKIDWVGRQTGSREMAAPAEYFQPEFMERLRREGTIQLPQFKVKHQGKGNTKTMDGTVYRDCDKVLIFDVDTSNQGLVGLSFLQEPLEHITSVHAVRAEQIQDLKIGAYVKEGIPVLGAVKIDLSGKARGFRFKAGFDLKTRRN